MIDPFKTFVVLYRYVLIVLDLYETYHGLRYKNSINIVRSKYLHIIKIIK